MSQPPSRAPQASRAPQDPGSYYLPRTHLPARTYYLHDRLQRLLPSEIRLPVRVNMIAGSAIVPGDDLPNLALAIADSYILLSPIQQILVPNPLHGWLAGTLDPDPQTSSRTFHRFCHYGYLCHDCGETVMIPEPGSLAPTLTADNILQYLAAALRHQCFDVRENRQEWDQGHGFDYDPRWSTGSIRWGVTQAQFAAARPSHRWTREQLGVSSWCGACPHGDEASAAGNDTTNVQPETKE